MLATALRSVHWHISTSVTSCGCRCPTELFGDDLDTAISKPKNFQEMVYLPFWLLRALVFLPSIGE